ncbi:MAG: zinc-binding alcohol dehydrogenase family protein [Candidatus Andeanibacterium colombiense]|uniref:Zinc-binding alcohol dehydrogenase family protein n=1 Tax=Candidatus Andeanibacterium colombiense TaxID=3121345 RepID=A0AAJ6BMU8_9SPHN|nr:MAG: zinc-binding alcohol dehydrogenase family protein [Sphingomonadaceae bacterium]
MKAAVVTVEGQAPAWLDFAEPAAAEGEQFIEVSAAALSPLTRARASGTHYSSAGAYPFVAGVDGVGRLEDGRRAYFVLPRAPFGAMGERSVVDAARVIPLPDELDDVTAAAIANPGMSSWAALTERAKLRAGETVLINGATGSSGRLAVKIARHMGAGKVIATGRDRTVLDSLGADVAIPLDGEESELERSFKPHFAQGVDVVLDYLWGPSARAALIAGARAGRDGVPLRFVQIGSIGGAEISLPGAVLRSSAIELMGSGIGSVSLDRLVGAIAALFAAATPAGLALPTVTMPLERVAEAWARGGRERVVVTIGRSR